mgnify:CR=1 FL=1
MNLDELRSAQAKERRKDSLQHLRDSFYDEVGTYVADLRAARDRKAKQVSDPFDDDDIRRLSDEIETAEEVAEALYERRVGKVVKLASFSAADMSVDEEGMTTEERALFDDLVDRIVQNKSTVLDVLAGGSAESAPVGVTDAPTDDGANESVDGSGESAAEPASNGTLAGAMGGDGPANGAGDRPAETVAGSGDASVSSADESVDGGPSDPGGDGPASRAAVGDGGTAAAGGPGDGATGGDATEPDATGADETKADATGADETRADATESAAVERATVRITKDVGAIFGVDEREYELASEDVVSLPVANADPLVERDAAERLD